MATQRFDALIEMRTVIDQKLALWRILTEVLRDNAATRALLKPKVEKKKIRARVPQNQFLVDVVQDMRIQAGQMHQTPQVGCFNRIICALSKYPLPILHPLQAEVLNGVGKNTVRRFLKIFKRKRIPLKFVPRSMQVKKSAGASAAKKAIKEHEATLARAGKDIDEEAQKMIESVPHPRALARLPPNLVWKLVLLRDNREPDTIDFETDADSAVEDCALVLGDFVWIVRVEFMLKGMLIRKEEYVLDYIVERKTTKDLEASEFSTHLNNQLSRMLKCRLPRRYLLLEGNFAAQEIVLSLQTHYGICIQQCRNKDETRMWLKLFTAEILALVRQMDFHALRDRVTFDSFTTLYRINVHLGDVFSEQMRQWPGVTPSKVPRVLSSFSTFAKLLENVQNRPAATAELLARLGLPAESIDYIQRFILTE